MQTRECTFKVVVARSRASDTYYPRQKCTDCSLRLEGLNLHGSKQQIFRQGGHTMHVIPTTRDCPDGRKLKFFIGDKIELVT
jgi:hypothetical protein